MAVGLNFNFCSKYLEWLADKQIVHVVDEDEHLKCVSLTPMGLGVYKTLVKSIKEIMRST